MRARRRASGYTVVELLMSLTVLAIGVSGIIAMQKVTVYSGAYARNLAVATHVAAAWLEQLVADGAQWNLPAQVGDPSNLAQNTTWLREVTNSPGRWVRPVWDELRQFGPGFDPLGSPVQNPDLARFCTDIRLIWLHLVNIPTFGNGLLRAEVRVFWPREGAATEGANVSANPCELDPPNDDGMGNSAQYNPYHWVYAATAVAQQPPEGS
jgi:type II secretory pathway pseudopilin PulG